MPDHPDIIDSWEYRDRDEPRPAHIGTLADLEEHEPARYWGWARIDQVGDHRGPQEPG